MQEYRIYTKEFPKMGDLCTGKAEITKSGCLKIVDQNGIVKAYSAQEWIKIERLS